MKNIIFGKTALITGASSGIGFETALLLKKLGMKVYGAARRIERMKELEDHGISVLSLDLTDSASIKNCVETILAKEGSIDVLVNNAGYGSYGAIENVPSEEAKRQFDVNVFGLAEISALVLPSMKKNHFGKIINISSMAGRFTAPFGGWYHATKHSVEALSDAMRLEVKPFGVDVILIEPGMIQTDWGLIATENLRKQSENTDYKSNAVNTALYLEKHYKSGKLTRPVVIAETIKKAVTAKHPKRRYTKGYMAKVFILLRKLLSDSLFDFALCISLGIK